MKCASTLCGFRVNVTNAKDFTEGTEFLTKGAFILISDGGSGGHSH